MGGAEQPAESVLIAAGGDVSFGRLRGQRLLAERGQNDFGSLASLLDAADLRFVNLESQLSDQHGETVSPRNSLVFVGPPSGADVLAQAGISVVSLANNHMWDYGRKALVETMDHLDRVGVAYVGASRQVGKSYEPRIVEHRGFRVAFFAVTDIWNQGPLRTHPARDWVAEADRNRLLPAIRKARARKEIAAIVVSYHGGYEYFDTPHEPTRRLLRDVVKAGADAIIGHHPHVLQRIEYVNDRPVLYSLGNLLMRMSTGKPWTEWGILAQIRLHRAAAPDIAVCPFRIHGLDPIPLAADPQRGPSEAFFRFHFERLLRVAGKLDPTSEAVLGSFGEDGCAPVRPTRRAGEMADQ